MPYIDYLWHWRRMPHEFPADQKLVWCRRHFFSKGFKATWDLATETFVTAGNISIPWYHIARWREIYPY